MRVPQPLRLGGLRLGASRLRGTAQSTEQIDFPTGLGTDVIEPLIPTVSRETLRDFPDRAIQGLTHRRRLGIEVGRRKEIGASRRRSRPRLSNPSKRRCQIEILVERSLDDASEVRVIEGQPPFVQAGRLPRGCAAYGSVVEVRQGRSARMVVRAHRTPR